MWLYQLMYATSISIYHFGIGIASLVNKKASKWVKGRKNVFQNLEAQNLSDCIWMHCSSLGEFEQGRPLLEAIKKNNTNQKILLTFFSPSGYEVRENYEFVDHVCYLPKESKGNATKFLQIVQPKLAIMVKYDLWFRYVQALDNAKIKTILISAVFRAGQIYFKPQGKLFKYMLHVMHTIYVQDEGSKKLLNGIDYESAIIAGDTRIDQVLQFTPNQLPSYLISPSPNDKKFTLCIGSLQPEDEQAVIPYLNNRNGQLKCILAPHTTSKTYITKLQKKITLKTKLFSQLETEESKNFWLDDTEVLIVDNIGWLQTLYSLADAAFVGGAFKSGLHNTLEPAAAELPITFGPFYHKFNEAATMIDKGGAHSVKDLLSFSAIMDEYLLSKDKCKEDGAKNLAYLQENKGATEIIMSNSIAQV